MRNLTLGRRASRRALVALALRFVAAIGVAAQAGASGVVTLEQLGDTSGLTLEGATPPVALTLPLPEGGIQSGQLTLRVDVGPSVDEPSILRVTGPDGRMLEVPLSSLRGSDGLRLPVGATPSEQLEVQLARTLGGSTAVCTPTTDGEWLRVRPDSALVVRADARAGLGGGIHSTTRWDAAG